MIHREDPQVAPFYDLPGSAERAKKTRARERTSPDYGASHVAAAERVGAEPRATRGDGKPRRSEPKLMPWDVLKRAGITREEVAGRIWRDGI